MILLREFIFSKVFRLTCCKNVSKDFREEDFSVAVSDLH